MAFASAPSHSSVSPRAWSFRGPDGKSYLGIVAKRAYRIVSGDRAVPSEDVPIHAALDVHTGWGPTPGGGDESDLLNMVKPTTDVVLTGRAHAPGGRAPVVDTAMRVGPVIRHVRVWGRRELTQGSRASTFSGPEPLESVELSWANAFGGIRHYGQTGPRQRRLSYPRNPFGRGFNPATPEGDPLSPLEWSVPQLEDPFDPILPAHFAKSAFHQWASLPMPAHYGPIHPFVFPRSAFFLRTAPERMWGVPREVAVGAITEGDLWFEGTRPPSLRVANCAPPGQAIARLEGSERVDLRNLHPARPELGFQLPADVPRFSLEVPGVGRRELPPLLGMVWIEPEADRVTLTWTGRLEVAWPYPDEVTAEMPAHVGWQRRLH
jgi:hypothetical protein